MKHSHKSVDPVLNKKIITDMKVILSDEEARQSQNTFCPFSYEMVTRGYNRGIAGDLNSGAGGKYVYICVKKKKIMDLLPTDKPVNVLAININNSECGKLRKSDKDLNSGAGGKYLYLCYGLDTNLNVSPFNNVYVNIREKELLSRETQSGMVKTECNLSNVSMDTGNNFIYLCYTRENMAPKKVVIQNFVLQTERKILEPGSKLSKSFSDFTLNNGNGVSDMEVKKSKSKSESSSKSSSGKHSNSHSLSFENEIGIPFFASVSIEVSINSSWEKSSSESNSKKSERTTDFTCTAPAGKYYKCMQKIDEGKYTIPYTYQKRYVTYSGKKILYNTSGVISQVFSSNIKGSSCCYRYCAASDNLCEDATLNKNTCPLATKELPQKEKVVVNKKVLELDAEYRNEEVITEMDLVVGEDTNQSCTYGYKPVTGTEDCTKFGCDLKKDEGGRTVYLCVKKTKMGSLKPGQEIINVFKILYGTTDCGNLKRVGGKTAHAATNGKKIIICYGNDPKNPLALITDIQIKMHKDAPVTRGFECDNTQITTEKEKYICVRRNSNLPRRVELKDLLYTNFRKANVSMPKILDEMEVSGGVSITKSITTTNSNERTSGFTQSYGGSLAIGISFEELIPGAGSNQRSHEYSNENSSETNKSKEESNTIEVTCSAPARKTNICKFFTSTQNIFADFTATQNFLNYEGIILTSKKLKGTETGTISSSVSMSICCVTGCCTGKEVYARHHASKPQCFDDKKQVMAKDITCDAEAKCQKDQEAAYERLREKVTTIKSSVRRN